MNPTNIVDRPCRMHPQMCDVGNREKSSPTNNEVASTHIANNIEIKTKHQKNINCKI
jgi:hypothetical protein